MRRAVEGAGPYIRNDKEICVIICGDCHRQ